MFDWYLNSLMISSFSFVLAQDQNEFADGEGTLLFDLLTGMDCIGNSKCAPFDNFTPDTACDFQPVLMQCTNKGLLKTL
jgi:hypothetical protein